MRTLLDSGYSMKEFDRQVFESIVDYVIVGGYDEQGNADPSRITFVYKTGFEDAKHGTDFKPRRMNAASEKLQSHSTEEDEKFMSQSGTGARGDGVPLNPHKIRIFMALMCLKYAICHRFATVISKMT